MCSPHPPRRVPWPGAANPGTEPGRTATAPAVPGMAANPSSIRRGEVAAHDVRELHPLGAVEDATRDQDVLEPIHGGGLDRRARLPDAEPAVALDAGRH